MAKQEINLGSAPNAGDGDPLRTAFNKINENFTELYNSTGGLDLSSITESIIPSVDNTYNLGSPSKRWQHGYFATGSLYVGDIKLSNNAGQLVVQQVTNVGLVNEAPVPDTPGVVTTDRIVNGVNTFAINASGELELNGDPFTGAESADSLTSNDDINITINNDDSSSYTWNFGQTGNLTIPGNIRKTTDASIEVDVGGSLGNIKVWTVDELVPPGGVWRLFIDDVDYPTLGTTVDIGDTVTTSWGTPITATIVDIQQDNGEWQIHVDQDITAGFANDDTVTFSTVVTTKTWTFGQDGSLTLPNGMSIDSYGTSGVNAVVSIGGDDTRITIDNNGAPPGLTITTNATAGMGQRQWNFGPAGDLTFPDGTTQTTAYAEGNTSGVFLLDSDGSINTITTPTTVVIDGMLYGGGEVVQDSAFGPGSSRVTLYADSMFAMVAVNADIETVYYNGETGADGDGTKTVSASVQNYRGFYARRNLIEGDDPAISQIVISKSSTMTAFHRSADTNNDDFTVTGLSGSDVVIVLNIYWDEVSGPSSNYSITTGVEKFIDLVMFDETTERTSASAIRTAFYAESGTIKNAIENEDGDYLTGENSNVFEFYEGYQAVTPTNITGSGTGALLSVRINDNATYNTDDILVPGTGYQVADELLVLGTVFGGTTPANDITITVTAINIAGGIDGWSVTGTAPTNYWPLSYIIDGDEDQYDTGNFIGTNRTRVTAVVTVDDTTSPDQLTIISTDKALINNGVGQWLWVEDQDEGALITWPLEINFGDIGDIVVEVDSEYTKLTLADKDFTLETTRTGTQDADINLFAADDIFIEANGDDLALSAKDQVRITTGDFNGDPEDYKTWRFDTNGRIQFPDGTFQTTAYPSDNDVWVQTFVSNTPTTDFPQIATSVEYDNNGNVIALFSHLQPNGAQPDSRYYSVGKYSATGTKLWTARFADDLETDGWGLAVDNADGWIYVAGQTGGNVYTYDVSTLTKIDSSDGSVAWSKIYDFGFASSSAVVDVDSTGNPVMVGWANNGADSYLTVTKINKLNGNVTWTRKLDGQTNEQAYGMAVGPDGEIVAVGSVDNLNYPEPYRTIVTLTATPASDPDWTTDILGATQGGLTYDVTFAGGVPTFSNIVDTDGNRYEGDLLVTFNASQLGSGSTNMEVRVGTTTGEDMSDRMVVVKYAANGTIAWQKAIQFDADYDCSGADADIDSNGNIYICGQFDIAGGGPTTTGMAIVKLDSTGAKQWSRRVTGDCLSAATSIVVGPDDKLYISGVNSDAIAETFTWVVAKYSLDGLVEWQRFIENTDGWTFAGDLFGPEGGGSNLAVRQGYVALAGGFGIVEGNEQSYAAILQIPDTGNVFAAGPWSVTAANLSGTLNGTASDIGVVNADLTDSDNALTVEPDSVTIQTEVGAFLIGTLYTAPGGDNSLVNGVYSVVLGDTGTVTLPAGGIITEGYVTSNPTIQLTPASPTVASQKLVIKGGGGFNYTYNDNGININYYDNTAIVGDTLTFYIYSPTYADQTLYWWIYPEGANISDPGSGTVALTGDSGTISFELDSDNYEFTVRVSPEDHNYGPGVIGVESGLINADDSTFDVDHHLHLTTGDLTETSIFLGTDDHNVRTTTDGGIEITTPNETNNVWQFGTDGNLTVPGDIRSEGNINIDINLSDSTLRRWSFGEDGSLTFPDATVQTTALVQGEQIFTLDTGAIDYAPTVVDFNLLIVTPAIGYSETDPTSVTLPNGVPGQRLVIFNGYNLATLTVNPGALGRDISSGVIAEFIFSSEGWIPLYGTNSPT